MRADKSVVTAEELTTKPARTTLNSSGEPLPLTLLLSLATTNSIAVQNEQKLELINDTKLGVACVQVFL